MRESKFKLLGSAVLCAAFFSFGLYGQNLSPRLQEKLDHAVETTFEVEGFSLEWVEVDAELNGKTPSELGGDNLFKVVSNGTTLGMGYLGEAPSMKNIFDYVVLFNPDLSIKKTKILIYREDYGRQVGSQRWLKQFIGKRAGETLTYQEDIDGISGATISAKSMTMAVDRVLQSVKLLQEHRVLE